MHESSINSFIFNGFEPANVIYHVPTVDRFIRSFRGNSYVSVTFVYTQKKESSKKYLQELFLKWRRPTLPRVCSTIGATGLNFSVRNGQELWWWDLFHSADKALINSFAYIRKKKSPRRNIFKNSLKNGGDLLSHGYAVPSARPGLTSLFGMGRGGTPVL